jgi:hypothetical protein
MTLSGLTICGCNGLMAVAKAGCRLERGRSNERAGSPERATFVWHRRQGTAPRREGGAGATHCQTGASAGAPRASAEAARLQAKRRDARTAATGTRWCRSEVAPGRSAAVVACDMAAARGFGEGSGSGEAGEQGDEADEA